MGKGKDKDDEERETHVSRPLESLKDPSSFGPPPKHVKYHGAAALPNETTPDRSGLGAPLSQAQLSHQHTRTQQQEAEEEEERRQAEQAAKRPPVPYRANRTGIDTSTLLPPPRRTGSVADSAQTSASPRPTPPSVPPRVPPRTNNSTPASHTPSPPPAYSPVPSGTEQSQPLEGHLNQGATSRLNQAGVSVPGLGIGAERSTAASPSSGHQQAPVNELQNRFSQMRTNSASSPSSAPPPARQAQSPSTSGSNVANAKSALNDFRSKHSDQIDSGKQKLTGINQKYGIKERFNNAIDSNKSVSGHHAPPVPPHPNMSPSPTATSNDTASLAQRKAPPPPPPQKKAGLRSTPVNTETETSGPAPPPLPLGTKPR